MNAANRWRGVALLAIGLTAGSILGPPIVQAATKAATSLVTIQGAGGTHKAKVDAAGNVMVNGQTRPLAPERTWSATEDVPGAANIPPTGVVLLTGPTSAPIDLTSLAISFTPATVSNGPADVRLMAAHVPNSATNCNGATFDKTLWHVPDITDGTLFTESFPTPLQWAAPSGTKACLFAHNLLGSTVTVNASGFIGG